MFRILPRFTLQIWSTSKAKFCTFLTLRQTNHQNRQIKTNT